MNDKIHSRGLHDATVIAHGWDESKTGTPSLKVRFESGEGQLTGWFYMTDKAAPHTIKKIRAMGYTGNDLRELGNGQVLVGNRCVIEVEHEVGNDNVQRAKVAFVNPAGYVPGVKNSENAQANITRFNALLKSEPTVAPAGSKAVEEEPFH